YSRWFRQASVSTSIGGRVRSASTGRCSRNSSTSFIYAASRPNTVSPMSCCAATAATSRSTSRGAKGTCRSSSRGDRLKIDLQIRDGSAEIGLRLRRPGAERALHLAHTALGPVECRPPSNRVWQDREQALVEKIVSPMDLTAKGRSVAARGSQDNAIGLCHLAGHKAAAVAGRDDDNRRHRGA